MAKTTSMAVDAELQQKVKIAASHRNLKVQEMTELLLQAGLEKLAPEVLTVNYNATSNITPEQFMELYRGEEGALSGPVLRRARRK